MLPFSPRLHHHHNNNNDAVGITIFMTTWLVEAVDGVFSPLYNELLGFQVFGKSVRRERVNCSE